MNALKVSIGRLIPAIFFIALALLIAISVASYHSTKGLLENTRMVRHTLEVRGELADALSAGPAEKVAEWQVERETRSLDGSETPAGNGTNRLPVPRTGRQLPFSSRPLDGVRVLVVDAAAACKLIALTLEHSGAKPVEEDELMAVVASLTGRLNVPAE